MSVIDCDYLPEQEPVQFPPELALLIVRKAAAMAEAFESKALDQVTMDAGRAPRDGIEPRRIIRQMGCNYGILLYCLVKVLLSSQHPPRSTHGHWVKRNPTVSGETILIGRPSISPAVNPPTASKTAWFFVPVYAEGFQGLRAVLDCRDHAS
ncbi:hypothetical protein [Pseudomonas soli]|uniref:hypothetical protein n=1 Tax=Pseudomonas soli TaxID=1306993 RepID=UPI0021AC2632|nr:hypothetical protein [Pseudomonas soli]